MADAPLFVARPTDVAALREHLEAARGGSSRTVLLTAPLGGGKRAVVGELVRGLAGDDDVLVIRTALEDAEDGFNALVRRLYGALYAPLVRDATLRGRVEMMLNAQLPKHPKRVQAWFQAFIEGVKKATPDPETQSFQVSVARDNPLIGFVEVLAGISRKLTTVLEIQNIHASQSIGMFQLVEALHQNAKDGKLLLILASEPVDDAAKAWFAEPWLDFLQRRDAELHKLALAPWGADEVASYVASKGLTAAAPGRIAEIAKGRPAYVAELVDVLAERDLLGSDLADQSLLTLVPKGVDEDELEEAPPPEEGKRRHATAEDAGRVHYLAALLGLAFPSGLLADMDGLDRDSVDDLLDASGDLVAEMQFSKGLDTWIYQFKKGIWRQAQLDAHDTEEDHKLALGVANWLDRFWVPRGFEYIVKTARMFAENAVCLPESDTRNGGLGRAAALRTMALTSDRPDMWGMAHDFVRYYEAIEWPEPMRRVVLTNLLDRMVQGGNVDQAESLYQEVLKFASDKEDRGLQAWTLFAGSRLDYRRQDHYRARDRARDALKLYTALDAKNKVAECENHLALIEFSDGNANAAIDHIKRALDTSNTPGIQANAEFIRGLIARRNKKHADAAEHFRKANEIAGQANIAALALEAGFHYGEALVQGGQNSKAADILLRVAQIAQALQNPSRERAAVALLAQTQGMLKNFEAALKWAQRTLQLTQELKFERLYALDIYNVAYFNLQLGRFTEAQSLFTKAAERAPADDANFLRELHFHSGVASLRIGEKSTAASSLREALKHANTTKAWPRVVAAAEHLAALEAEGGDKAAAARLLQDALKAADAGNLREERKGIRRKLDEIGG